jgi:hypothetical protein
MADEKDPGFIYVEAGPELEQGQIAILEADPAHPWVDTGDGIGENQARIVKGDPNCNEGWVGPSARALTKLSREELVRKDAPSGPRPSLTRPQARTATASTTSAPPDVQVPDGDPTDAWTVAQIDKFAADRSIDLGGATNKADKLAAINAARKTD